MAKLWLESRSMIVKYDRFAYLVRTEKTAHKELAMIQIYNQRKGKTPKIIPVKLSTE